MKAVTHKGEEESRNTTITDDKSMNYTVNRWRSGCLWVWTSSCHTFLCTSSRTSFRGLATPSSITSRGDAFKTLNKRHLLGGGTTAELPHRGSDIDVQSEQLQTPLWILMPSLPRAAHSLYPACLQIPQARRIKFGRIDKKWTPGWKGNTFSAACSELLQQPEVLCEIITHVDARIQEEATSNQDAHTWHIVCLIVKSINTSEMLFLFTCFVRSFTFKSISSI